MVIAPVGIPAKCETTHVYLSIGNGMKSVKLYVYTLRTSDHKIKMIQEEGQELKFGKMSTWPTTLLSYTVRITNNVVLLKTQSGQQLKLP